MTDCNKTWYTWSTSNLAVPDIFFSVVQFPVSLVMWHWTMCMLGGVCIESLSLVASWRLFNANSLWSCLFRWDRLESSYVVRRDVSLNSCIDTSPHWYFFNWVKPIVLLHFSRIYIFYEHENFRCSFPFFFFLNLLYCFLLKFFFSSNKRLFHTTFNPIFLSLDWIH